MTNRIISKLDYQRLIQRIDREQATTTVKLSSIEMRKLLGGVDYATLLDPAKIPGDVVTMNSVVSLEYVDTGRKVDICLVYPEEADAGQNRISIFAPLAIALLGHKRGTLTSLPTPFGSVNVLIRKIIYQPEAAGDYAR